MKRGPAPREVVALGPAPASSAAPSVVVQPRRVSSRDLLGGRVEIEIEHDAQIYRLRRTSLGKLILTK
jgi:hemin uptake protein HemP